MLHYFGVLSEGHDIPRSGGKFRKVSFFQGRIKLFSRGWGQNRRAEQAEILFGAPPPGPDGYVLPF